MIDIGACETFISKTNATDTIAGTVRWNADTVDVNNNIYIKDSAILMISPGTKIMFHGHYGITVHGTIIAKGEKNNKIIFTIADTTGFSDLTSDTGSWAGIVFDNDFTYIDGVNTGANGKMSDNDSSIFKNCIFEYSKRSASPNWENKFGGAISIRFYSGIDISNCIFRYNASFYGGAISISNISSPVINHNVFYKNHAQYNGGAIYVELYSNPVLIGNLITGNYASGSDYCSGGGIFLSQCNGVLINNIISKNYAKLLGGGISLTNANPIFANNTLVYNSAGYAGGIYIYDASPAIYNSVFWGNKGRDGSEITNQNDKTIFRNCNIEDYKTWPNFEWNFGDTLGLVSGDPKFIKVVPSLSDTSFLSYDYRTTSFSGNINKGTLEMPGITLPSTDFYGNSRINEVKVDIGSVENQAEKIEILKHPIGAVLCKGDPIVFSVTANDTAHFQWQKDGNNISGADLPEYKIKSVTEDDIGNYICVVSNAYGTVYSNNVSIQVNTAPEIISQLQNQFISAGSLVTIEAVNTGTKPISYKWYKNGFLMKNDTASSIYFESFGSSDEGTYYCTIFNSCGSISTNSAEYHIQPQIALAKKGFACENM